MSPRHLYAADDQNPLRLGQVKDAYESDGLASPDADGDDYVDDLVNLSS